MRKVYISCPIIVSTTTLETIRKRAEEANNTIVKIWNRDSWSYDPDMLNESEDIIIVHPNNKFKFPVRELPTGVLSELRRAFALHKNIYLAYQNTAREFNFYEVEFSEGGNFLSAIVGTTGTYFKAKKKEVTQKKELSLFTEKKKLLIR